MVRVGYYVNSVVICDLYGLCLRLHVCSVLFTLCIVTLIVWFGLLWLLILLLF